MYTRLRSMSIRLNNTISRLYECAEFIGVSEVTQSKGQDCCKRQVLFPKKRHLLFPKCGKLFSLVCGILFSRIYAAL